MDKTASMGPFSFVVRVPFFFFFSFLVESSDYKFHNLLDVFQIPLIMGLSDLVALFLIKVGVGVHEWLDLLG